MLSCFGSPGRDEPSRDFIVFAAKSIDWAGFFCVSLAVNQHIEQPSPVFPSLMENYPLCCGL